MQLTNKTALITGASKGIGAETARIFAQAGANVVLVARSGAQIDALAAEIGPKARAVCADVAEYGALEAAADVATQSFGGVDILVNNAGVIDPIGALAATDPQDWGRLIDINLKGVMNGMRAVVPGMKSRGGGSVLTISSGAAHSAIEGWSAYCSSKAAVNMLGRCLHHEEGANGIRVIGLSPGTVATQMQRTIKASGINPVSKLAWEDHIPADWPAKCLLWMCSADADAYLGQEISLRDDAVRKAVGLI